MLLEDLNGVKVSDHSYDRITFIFPVQNGILERHGYRCAHCCGSLLWPSWKVFSKSGLYSQRLVVEVAHETNVKNYFFELVSALCHLLVFSSLLSDVSKLQRINHRFEWNNAKLSCLVTYAFFMDLAPCVATYLTLCCSLQYFMHGSLVH